MALPPACFIKMTPGLGSSAYVVYRCHKQRRAGIGMYDGNGKRPVAPDIVFSHGHIAFGNSYSGAPEAWVPASFISILVAVTI